MKAAIFGSMASTKCLCHLWMSGLSTLSLSSLSWLGVWLVKCWSWKCRLILICRNVSVCWVKKKIVVLLHTFKWIIFRFWFWKCKSVQVKSVTSKSTISYKFQVESKARKFVMSPQHWLFRKKNLDFSHYSTNIWMLATPSLSMWPCPSFHNKTTV